MRNLFLFIARFHAFILFVLIETGCVVMMVQSKAYHQAGFFNSANFIAGAAYERYHNVTSYFKLRNVNESLMKENAWLRSQLPSAYYNMSHQEITVKDSAHHQVYRYIPAGVLNMSTNRFSNYITIDKGLSQGVKPRMAVICSEGIVGIVKDASEHFAVVIPLLHKAMKVSGRVGAEGFIGTVSWDGKDSRYAQLDEIPKQVAVKNGDKVMTGGGSEFFPDDLMIGTVEKADKNTANNFYDIRVRLSTPFASLTHVYVIDYMLRGEQTQLEQHSRLEQTNE